MNAQQLDMFAMPAPMPIGPEPLCLRFSVDAKRPWSSYAEAFVRENEDGTWSARDSYAVNMYCGGGGPYWGNYSTFRDALKICIDRLLKTCRFVAFTDKSSCCGESQRRDAKKLVEWLEGIASEYGVTSDA